MISLCFSVGNSVAPNAVSPRYYLFCEQSPYPNVKDDLATVIHSDGWRGYNGLVDLGYKKHFRVQHGHNEFANRKSHINGIESFWAYAKIRINKFRGPSRNTVV